MRALVVAALLWAGCRGGVDACAALAGQSCVALRVRGALGPVEQVEVSPLSGFSLVEERTPPQPGTPFSLPVLVPLALGNFAGPFALMARALVGGRAIGVGTAAGQLQRGEHRTVEVTLTAAETNDGGDDGGCSPSLDSDPRNCGACGRDCTALDGVDPARVACVNRACVLDGACLPGRADCIGGVDDGCETEISSAASCGGCGQPCAAATPFCVSDSSGYRCTDVCGPSAPDRCGDSCVNLDNDPKFCGACNVACSAPPGGIPVCAQRRCDFVCSATSMRVGNTCVDWKPESSGVSVSLRGVWGSSPTDLWTAGDDGYVLRSTGNGQWSLFRRQGNDALSCITGVSASDVLVCDVGAALRWNGIAWTQTLLGNLLLNGGAATASRRLLVGQNVIYSLEPGTNWRQEYSPIAGVSPLLLGAAVNTTYSYAVGIDLMEAHGVVLGALNLFGSWTVLHSSTRGLFAGVWADDGELIVVGSGGLIVRYLDGKWVPEASGTTLSLYAVTRVGDRFYVVGQGGTVLTSTGDGRWSPQVSGTNVDLKGVWGSGTAVWAVGDGGTILRKL